MDHRLLQRGLCGIWTPDHGLRNMDHMYRIVPWNRVRMPHLAVGCSCGNWLFMLYPCGSCIRANIPLRKLDSYYRVLFLRGSSAAFPASSRDRQTFSVIVSLCSGFTWGFICVIGDSCVYWGLVCVYSSESHRYFYRHFYSARTRPLELWEML
jgi:hypothetical protein